MLREVGNKNKEVEENFLKEYYKNMPRTMIRYAIEKFDKEERRKYLNRNMLLKIVSEVGPYLDVQVKI